MDIFHCSIRRCTSYTFLSLSFRKKNQRQLLLAPHKLVRVFFVLIIQFIEMIKYDRYFISLFRASLLYFVFFFISYAFMARLRLSGTLPKLSTFMTRYIENCTKKVTKKHTHTSHSIIITPSSLNCPLFLNGLAVSRSQISICTKDQVSIYGYNFNQLLRKCVNEMVVKWQLYWL